MAAARCSSWHENCPRNWVTALETPKKPPINHQETTKETWKPSEGDNYFFINAFAVVDSQKWEGWSSDNGLLDIGNCFRTKEEALAKAEQIKKLLKEL